jgi:hypothetical protein
VAADSSAATLLACNVVALVFAFFNPPVSVSVLFLYWAECAVIGVLNVVKLWYVPTLSGLSESEMAQMTPGTRLANKCIGPGIFVVHYGIFLFMVFSVLYALGEHEMQGRGVRHYHMASHLESFWLPVLVIGAGHVVAFSRNFLGKREYATRNFSDQMFQPYKRTILLMLVMFGGVGLIILTGLPDIGLIFFIPFMLIASLEAHFRERAA